MKFALKAVAADRQIVAMEIEAADEAAARTMARERGYAVLATRRMGLLAIGARRVAFPAMLFTIELLALLDAGLNVVEALQTLAEKEPRGTHRQVLLGLLDALKRGEPLSQATSRFPASFSPLYTATIRSSERTGNIKEALQRFIAYHEEIDKVRRKAFSALLYPAILAAVGALVLAFLMFYVVPRFATVYEDIDTELPLFSAMLFAVGRWTGENVAFIGAGLAAAAAALCYAATSTRIRAQIAARLWRLPGLGPRLKLYQLSRLYRTVGMLLRSGVPALRALEMVGGLLAPNLRQGLDEAMTRIREGRSISAALTAAGLATPVATRMMRVGERSGQMGELMDRTARFYDDETARFVDNFTRVLEPVLMAALGLAVGAVVVLMYMPIFELAGAIQ